MRSIRPHQTLALLTACAVVAWSGSAFALPFNEGDVFAAVANGQVQHYNSAGVLLETLDTTQGGFTTGMAFDDANSLYVTNFSASTISRFNSNGTLTDPIFVNTGSTGAAQAESIAFDAAGNFYVGNAQGNRDVLKYSAAGVLLDTFDVATQTVGSDWIDLAADQKTLFYTSEGTRIMRFDTSTDTQLADFAVLGEGQAFALRLLEDGGLLVADRVNVKRLDNTGAVVQTYDVAGNDDFFSLNLDPDGTSFWAGDFNTGNLFKFDIDTTALLQTINTSVGSGRLFGVTVLGEITIGDPDPEDVPEPASVALFLLGLAGLGTLMRRRTLA